MLSNFTYFEIQWLSMQIARKMGQVFLVGEFDYWMHCHSGRKLVLDLPTATAHVYSAVNLVMFCES